ncbi:MAG TPA: Na+/H+ antiporter NhaA [Gammaproteobacteria bacterium]|nr:Na+/H+ antiporter NhaA [Gammaproteobacteria bacterium]
MKQSENQDSGIYHAPWEKSFDKVITPFEEFIHRQTTSGMLLMATAILALVLANSTLAGLYSHILHIPVSISIGGWTLEKTLHHWVNDGLMTLFFFVVGLELKREILVGELADLRRAALPMIAAIGGMLVPALIYMGFNPVGEAARGWGIPMATDIAFAIGALVLLARRVPKSLITFLVALAIVDDLGAVAVIAIFYTETLVYDALWIALALFGLLIIFNRVGIRRISPYAIVAVFLWYFLLKSGIHATIAGVLGAFTVPAIPKYDPQRFSRQVKNLISRFDKSYESGKNIMNNVEMRSVVQTLENGILRVEAPLQRLEHAWHLPVAFLVVPIFALFNAGIPLQLDSLGASLSNPVTLGIGVGLIGGKFIGITLSSWLAIKLGIAQLPPEIRFTQIAGVSLLAGIGFTMAIFIAELGFANQPEYLLMAKTGILAASLLAGISGYVWLRIVAHDS